MLYYGATYGNMKMYEGRSIFYITCYLLYGKIELNFNYKT